MKLCETIDATGLSRRAMLRGALGGAALLGASGLLTACGGGGSVASGPATGALTFGSNQSDDVPKKAFEQIVAGFGGTDLISDDVHNGRVTVAPGAVVVVREGA